MDNLKTADLGVMLGVALAAVVFKYANAPDHRFHPPRFRPAARFISATATTAAVRAVAVISLRAITAARLVATWRIGQGSFRSVARRIIILFVCHSFSRSVCSSEFTVSRETKN